MMRTVWLVLMLLSGAIAHAASFDCRKANTVREKAVCDSPDLNELDEQMADAYKSVLADAPARLIAEIRDGWDAVCEEVGMSAVDRAFLWGRQFLNAYALEGYPGA